MAVSITIDNLDGHVLERLRAEAQRRGVDLSVVGKELRGEVLPPLPEESSPGPYRDVDVLAGTWSDDEADALLAAIADFGRVDEDLWK